MTTRDNLKQSNQTHLNHQVKINILNRFDAPKLVNYLYGSLVDIENVRTRSARNSRPKGENILCWRKQLDGLPFFPPIPTQ